MLTCVRKARGCKEREEGEKEKKRCKMLEQMNRQITFTSIIALFVVTRDAVTSPSMRYTCERFRLHFHLECLERERERESVFRCVICCGHWWR